MFCFVIVVLLTNKLGWGLVVVVCGVEVGVGVGGGAITPQFKSISFSSIKKYLPAVYILSDLGFREIRFKSIHCLVLVNCWQYIPETFILKNVLHY